MGQPKVAIVHEWFTTLAGSEKVVEQICHLYPQADIFCIVADPSTLRQTAFLQGRRVRTSFIQSLPRASRSWRLYLPFMPVAIEQFDLSGYDIIISSSHAVSKGVITGPDQLHICYIHSPIRYAWDLQHQYLREAGLDRGPKGWLARWALHKIRIWDYRTAAGVDYFIANSRFISRRVHKVYGRAADVIYPPVDVTAFEFADNRQGYYLAASRLVPYKRMDLIVRAFANMPERNLVLIGDGPDMDKVRSLATGNVKVLGYQPFEVLKRYMQQSRAFIFAAEEDFGIIPVEAQACGTPVIAYGKGGSLETVLGTPGRPDCTGIWFREQTVESLIEAVEAFELLPQPISPQACRAHAERFSVERFRTEFAGYVDTRWAGFQAQQARD